MGNMSYVRFENTNRDLKDCLEALREYDSIEEYIEDNKISDSEKEAIGNLIENCENIVDEFGDYDEEYKVEEEEEDFF